MSAPTEPALPVEARDGRGTPPREETQGPGTTAPRSDAQDGQDPADASTAGGATGRALWRRYRILLLVLALLVLVALVVAVARTRSVGGRLDPRTADREGGRALATLLDERGVDVERSTDPVGVVSGVGRRTIVFVPFGNLVPDEALRRLGALSTGTVVLVGPQEDELDAVTDDVSRTGTRLVEVSAADCTNATAQAAGDALVGGGVYTTSSGDTCYPGPGGDEDGGSLVTGRTRGGANLVVLGTGSPLTNESLAEDGNAALGLNLLGADGSADDVRWLVPAPGSAIDDDDSGSLAAILPDWVGPAAVQLLLAGLLLMVWRGRRLGPPVTEPLPVVVRAAEVVEGRARLYRRAQARVEAGTALRSGALARLVPRLGIDPGAGGDPAPEAVVSAVAGRSGRPDAEVHAALYGAPPTDDAGLVRLSETLDSLVRSTLDPEVPHP